MSTANSDIWANLIFSPQSSANLRTARRESATVARNRMSGQESDIRQACHRKNRRLFSPLCLAAVLVTAVVLAGIVVFLLVSLLGNVRETPAARCSNDACVNYARILEASLNYSADPCHDFDAFVCAGWRRSEAESVRSAVALRTLEAMTQAVRTGPDPPPKGQSVPQKVALLYRSCDAVVREDVDDMVAIREQLRLAGVDWPHRAATPDVPRTLTFLSAELDWPAVLTVGVTKKRELFVLRAPSFTETSTEQKRLLASAQKRQRTFDLLKERFADGRVDNSSIKSEDLAPLEDAFFRALDAASSTNAKYLPTSDVPEWSTLFRVEEWQRAVAQVNLTPATRYKRTVSWFTLAFFRLWRRFGDADTHLFVSWVAVRYAAKFCSKDLIANYHDTGSLYKVQFEHGLFCYGLTYRLVGDAVFAPYIGNVFSPLVREDVGRIVTSVREKFLAALSRTEPFSLDLPVSTSWASLASVFSVLEPTPSSYSNLSVLPDMGTSFSRNWRAAAKVRRIFDAAPSLKTLGGKVFKSFFSYVLKDKEFKLTPYVLSYPIYEHSLVDALKFGGLGGEVSRALAEVVIRYYKRNSLATAAIREAAECIANASMRAGTERPHNFTTRDLATVVVLKDAFAEAPGASERLQNSWFSPPQLMFIAWCYLRCPGRSQRLSDYCGGVLRHLEAFSEAFGCSPGTPLNPVDKCRFF
ncbi:uncharacterized protein LOC144141970 [Haemaphysalis longicornis]